MQHPERSTLVDYAERRLDVRAISDVILHLDQCPECFEVVETSTSRSKQLIDLQFADSERDAFHLSYAEHLEPFVDETADAVTREIVETHTDSCSACAFQLRELREFAETLRLHEIERQAKQPLGLIAAIRTWAASLSHNRALRLVLPAAALLLIGMAAFLYQRTLPEPELTAEPVANVSPASSDDAKVEPVADTDTAEVADGNPSDASTTLKLRAIEPKIDRAEIKAVDIVGKAPVAPSLRLPDFLALIRPRTTLRGKSDPSGVTLSPNGEAVRNGSPDFAWPAFGPKGGQYILELFDENDDPVMVSPPVTATHWRFDRPLRQGSIYKWEVRTEDAKSQFSAFAGRFKVLDERALAAVNAVSVAKPFDRGVALASNGLLTEAKAAFRQAIKTGDRADLARQYLRQITTDKN